MKKKDLEKINKFQLVLNKYNLVPKGEQLFSLSARFFSFKAENQKGEKFWIKIAKNKKAVAVRHELIREIKVLKKVDVALNNSNTSLDSLQFVAGETKKYPEWLIYKFAPGRESGDILLGYNPSFLTDQNLKKINNTFIKVQKINVKNINLPKKRYSWYISEFNKYTKKFPNTFHLSPRLFDECQIYLKTHKKEIEKPTLVLSHGDLFPQNFLKFKEHYTIIDWGSAQLVNPAYDLATIYFNARRNKKFQNKLLKKYSSPGFTAAVIRLTVMTMNNYGNIYDHPESWDNNFPYYRKEYYTKIHPQIKIAWQDHKNNLTTLLNI